MKLSFISVICLIAALFFSPSFAEYYQWMDAKGVKHFSDNILDVPENQRQGLRVHREILTTDDPANQNAAQNEALATQRKNQARQKEEQYLIEQRVVLETEYKSLAEKRQAIVNKKPDEDMDAYNQQVQTLNEQTVAFEKKRMAYEARLQAWQKQEAEPSMTDPAKPDGSSEE